MLVVTGLLLVYPRPPFDCVVHAGDCDAEAAENGRTAGKLT
jgi:hypothetical protein